VRTIRDRMTEYLSQLEGEVLEADYEAHIADLTRQIEANPNDSQLFFARAVSLFLHGDIGASVADLARVIEQEPKKGDYYSFQALMYLLDDDPDTALTSINGAIAEEPENPEHYAFRAMMTEDREAALVDHARAIELAPDHADYYLDRAGCHVDLENPAAALPDLDTFVELAPKNPVGWGARGDVHFRLGQYEQALADFERLYQLKPGALSVHMRLAITKHALGRSEEAYKMWGVLLRAVNERFNDAEWVLDQFDMDDEMAEELRALIAGLPG
jgi:tetratricopeptide (TPR) repeat protein